MPKSQVHLKTVFTVTLGTLLIVTAVFAVLHSLLAITLTGAALLLTLALEHAVQFLMKRRAPRLAAIAIVALLVLGFLTGIGFTLIPPVVSQGKALIQRGPDYIRRVKESKLARRLDERFSLSERLEDAEKGGSHVITGAASPVLAAVGGVLSFVGASVTVFFVTIMMLVFGGPLVRGALRELPRRQQETVATIASQVYQSVGGYIAGLALICMTNATCTTVFLAINRVPFFLPLGVLSGLSSTVPYAGPVVAGAFVSLLSFLAGGWWHGLATVIYFVVYGQIEGNILGPLIFRKAIRVNPLVVMLSILFLGEIGGVVGAVLAVPLAATLQVVLRELLSLRAAEELSDGK
jgi:predicted PurR-regulated permease PerM